MSNYFPQEYHLSPLVEDLYAVIEKHCGNPTQPLRLTANTNDIQDAMMASLAIWVALAKRGVQTDTARRLNVNRNTLRKNIANNKQLAPVANVLFNRDPMRDMYALKCKMGLAHRE